MQGRGERQRHWLRPKFPSSPQASEWPGSYARCPDTLAALPHLWESQRIIINSRKQCNSIEFHWACCSILNNCLNLVGIMVAGHKSITGHQTHSESYTHSYLGAIHTSRSTYQLVFVRWKETVERICKTVIGAQDWTPDAVVVRHQHYLARVHATGYFVTATLKRARTCGPSSGWSPWSWGAGKYQGWHQHGSAHTPGSTFSARRGVLAAGKKQNSQI